jgi:hypothetical protein
MAMARLAHYRRSAFFLLALIVVFSFAFSPWRLEAWSALLPFFEWMESTPAGVASKTWGAVFALVEAFHLLGMCLLGGAVIISDGRLLGLLCTDIPVQDLTRRSHRVFVVGLGITIATGIFMACGVAIKVYYLPVFWYKMLALATGVFFVYGVKQPLLARVSAQDPVSVKPWLLKLVALASLGVWFTVAATGRWIGYSG